MLSAGTPDSARVCGRSTSPSAWDSPAGVPPPGAAGADDGAVRLDVLDGSALKTDWSVNTGDGSISLRLPANLDADLDAHTGDGGVHADGLPAQAERDNDNRENREKRDSLRAQLGKGGRTLRLRSGDGSINISR